MNRRWKLWLLVAALISGGMRLVFAQAPATPPPLVDGSTSGTVSNWRAPGASGNAGNLQPLANAPRAPIAKVTEGTGTLPNDAGQVWREYDITPYTLRVTSTNRPEQAVVDWILRETGYDAWHGEPLGILSANGRTLKVYHTPQMQEQVSEIVDRFVNSQNQMEAQAFGIRLITIGSPDWRAKMQQVLRPVPVQSQGTEAWLLSKEDAALMFAELQKRTDFREHSSPHVLVQNGQATVISATRPQNYIKDVILKQEVWPGFQPEMGQIAEGFSLEFKPLLSLDGKMIDAVVKCNIDQVEKMESVMLDVPTAAAPRQRTKIQVPQLNSMHFAEKFHWPTDMVLVIGFGIVPMPSPQEPAGVKIPLVTPDNHADLLVVVENRGVGGKPPSVARNFPPASTTPVR